MVDKILEMGQEDLLLSDDDLFGSESESSDGDSSSSRDRVIPRSEFEGMPLEYPSYVKSNVKPGCYVKLLLSPISPSGGRSLGDDFIAGAGSVGIVTSVRPDALLNEESIFVKFTRGSQTSIIKVKPSSIELISLPDDSDQTQKVDTSGTPIQIGESVRIMYTVLNPYYNWGKANHHAIGTVRDINGKDVVIDFPNHIGWHGRIDEIERAIHSPKRIISDCEKIVEERQASSNIEDTMNLFDRNRNTFWKSSREHQSDNEIWVEFKIREGSGSSSDVT